MSTKVNTKILDLLCMLPIAVLVFIIYKDSLNDFTTDNWIDLDYIEAAHSNFYLYFYPFLRPTQFAIQDLIYSLSGPSPVLYHIVTLCIHLIDSFFVFAIAKKIAGDRLVGFLASLLFATSWLHPDAVLFFSVNVLVAFFSMCCLIFFYKYRLNPTWFNYLLSLFAFVLAIGTKEPAIMFLPVLLYLTDRYIALESQDMSPKTSLNLSKKAYVPFLLMSVLWFSFAVYIMRPSVWGTAGPSLLRSLYNLFQSFTFSFTFPLFSESPRLGNINLILVILFYFFSPVQIKRRLLLLMIAMVIIYLPTSRVFSPTLRYLYPSAVFSMIIFTATLYYGSIQLSKKMKVLESAKFLIVLYVFLLAYSQLSFVSSQMEYYNRTGHILRNFLKTVKSTFPKDTLGAHLIFVNFPDVLELENPCWNRLGLWRKRSIKLTLNAYYGSSNVGQVSEVVLGEVYGGRDQLLGKRISIREFEELIKEKGNTVYFFNSKDDSIHDVTGKDYTFLGRLVGGS